MYPDMKTGCGVHRRSCTNGLSHSSFFFSTFTRDSMLPSFRYSFFFFFFFLQRTDCLFAAQKLLLTLQLEVIGRKNEHAYRPFLRPRAIAIVPPAGYAGSTECRPCGQPHQFGWSSLECFCGPIKQGYVCGR